MLIYWIKYIFFPLKPVEFCFSPSRKINLFFILLILKYTTSDPPSIIYYLNYFLSYKTLSKPLEGSKLVHFKIRRTKNKHNF